MKDALISLVQTNMAIVGQDAEVENNMEGYDIKTAVFVRNRARMNSSSTA